jgi:RecB family exonuclease
VASFLLRVSYSAVKTWRKCQQAYWYQYVEHLQPKVRQAAPELGSILHDDYFQIYYGLLKRGERVTASHAAAKQALARKQKDVRRLARTAAMVGADDVAASLRGIVPNALVLADAYHRVHKEADAKHKILLVEEEFELPVRDGIVLPGRIDMVTGKDKDVWLWEHKTTGNVPGQEHRFRDLQTLLYSYAVEELTGRMPAGVIWNYVRTTPPHAPQLLKNGSLSTAKNQTTTLDLYVEAIRANGLALKEYQPFLRHVEQRERQEMFPRYSLPILGSPKVLLRDYANSVEEIAEARAKEKFRPVRNVDIHCGWCPFKALCNAAILGGETAPLKKRFFTRAER